MLLSKQKDDERARARGRKAERKRGRDKNKVLDLLTVEQMRSKNPRGVRKSPVIRMDALNPLLKCRLSMRKTFSSRLRSHSIIQCLIIFKKKKKSRKKNKISNFKLNSKALHGKFKCV